MTKSRSLSTPVNVHILRLLVIVSVKVRPVRVVAKFVALPAANVLIGKPARLILARAVVRNLVSLTRVEAHSGEEQVSRTK